MTALVEGEDFYLEHGLVVFTASYLRRRGYCCGSGCRHCPWPPEVQRATMRRCATGLPVLSVADMRNAIIADRDPASDVEI